MNSGLRYAHVHQNFALAISDMAASSEPLRKRLEDAVLSHLAHLLSSEFPEELRPRFEQLKKELTSQEPTFADQGTIAATCQQMSPKKAKQLIEEICSIAFQLAHVYYSK